MLRGWVGNGAIKFTACRFLNLFVSGRLVASPSSKVHQSDDWQHRCDRDVEKAHADCFCCGPCERFHQFVPVKIVLRKPASLAVLQEIMPDIENPSPNSN